MKRFAHEKELIQDYLTGMSWIELQSKYNCSVTTVHAVLKRNNIGKRTWSTEKQELFKQMYLSNCTYPEMRAAFNICSSNITFWAHRLGLPLRGSGRKNQFANKFADNTPESNYWLGYFFADGHLSFDEKRRSNNISIYTEKEYVVDAFKKWFGDGTRVYKKYYTTKAGERKIMYQIAVFSTIIVKWFSETLGVSSNKHHSLNPNVKINWDIVRGYFDGDGSMTKGGKFNIKSCSRIWLERIQKFMENFEIHPSVRLSYRDCYGLYIENRKDLSKVLQYMYEHPYYCHEYKHTNLVNRVAVM